MTYNIVCVMLGMSKKITTKHGTFIWNSKNLRVSQIVSIKDLTGRHGSQIGTSRVAITEAKTYTDFVKYVTHPPIINGKVFGLVKKGEILNKTIQVVSI